MANEDPNAAPEGAPAGEQPDPNAAPADPNEPIDQGEPGEPAEPKRTVNDSRNAIIAKARVLREQEIADNPDKVAQNAMLSGRGVENNSGEPLALSGQTRTLTVDGQSIEVPVEQVEEAGIRALQKEGTADLKLQRASAAEQLAAQTLADAERIRREAERGLPSGAPGDDANGGLPSGDQPGRTAMVDETVAQVQEALFDGDSDKAKGVVAETLRKVSSTATRAEVIRETNEAFVTDFDDIAANPVAMAKATLLMKAELAKNPAAGKIPVIAARVGNMVRSEMLKRFDAPGVRPNAEPENRAVLKARLPAMPSQASQRVPDGRQAEAPRLTPKQIVQQMQKQRGQAVAG